MRHAEVTDELRGHAFEFFYWFSRFEFALKECGYLKRRDLGASAEPGWKDFIEAHEATYTLSVAAHALIAADPKRQVVSENGFAFRSVGDDDHPSDLERVVRLAKTVRNNLFHGGKHGYDDWDDRERMMLLLPMVIAVLDELADHAGMEGDYRRNY